MIAILEERVRAKELAKIVGLEIPSAWRNAEADLEAAKAAEGEREAAESAQRRREEAERLRKAHELHAIARSRLAELRQKDAEQNQILRDLGPDAMKVYDGNRDWITGPQGRGHMASHYNPKLAPPATKLPPGVSWPELELGDRVYKVLIRRRDLANQMDAAIQDLNVVEREFPALRDLRD